ncbi:hypothetical protein [Halocatena salina]|uniref:Uncharacterized protein n=1 Tax=Halocatena salina TaxID=2934340 RepID=A0A8U0A4L8_9EURY|nr:hypothetical protein [Halocatena salina]UPM43729.1 hypothetical protein MW046_04595 [Halocatena salina]
MSLVSKEIDRYSKNETELDSSNAHRDVGTTRLSTTASQSGEYALKVESVAEVTRGMQDTIYVPASEAPTKELPEIGFVV